MTREDLLLFAQKSGLCWINGEPKVEFESLEKFASLVAAYVAQEYSKLERRTFDER